MIDFEKLTERLRLDTSGQFSLDDATDEEAAELDRRLERVDLDAKRWWQPGAKPSKLQQGVSYVSTVLSGAAPTEVVAARLAACEACPKILRKPSGIFCGACGCGTAPRAELHKKAAYAKDTCRLKKWPQ